MSTLVTAAPRLRPLLVAGVAVTGVAALGALATHTGSWYIDLAKPAWQPPGWLFGPAWSVILALTAAALASAWRASDDASARRRLIVAFAVNAVFNVAWSVLFFTFEHPDWALVEVFGLWGSIAWLMVVCRPMSRAAVGLLSPYLAWVTFAAVLNATIVALNAPF